MLCNEEPFLRNKLQDTIKYSILYPKGLNEISVFLYSQKCVPMLNLLPDITNF
jgi:hypothetical protein